MLVLTRKKDESIIIDGRIEVTIVESSKGKVRIGISAPSDVEILRKEVYENVLSLNKESVASKKFLRITKDNYKDIKKSSEKFML